MQKEIGLSLSHQKRRCGLCRTHFILGQEHGREEMGGSERFDFGEFINGIYPVSPETTVLADRNGSVALSTNHFGRGRSVYLAGLPFNFQNVGLLRRILFWVADKVQELNVWSSTNLLTEAAFYPEARLGVVINHSAEKQDSAVFDDCGRSCAVELEPYGRRWFRLEEFA